MPPPQHTECTNTIPPGRSLLLWDRFRWIIMNLRTNTNFCTFLLFHNSPLKLCFKEHFKTPPPPQLKCSVHIQKEYLCLKFMLKILMLICLQWGTRSKQRPPNIPYKQVFWTYDTACIYYFYWNHRVKCFKITTGKLYICNSLQNKIFAFCVSLYSVDLAQFSSNEFIFCMM